MFLAFSRRELGVQVAFVLIYRLVIDGKKIQSGVGWSTGAGTVVVMVHPTAYRRGCDDTSIPVDTSMMHLVTIPRYQCFRAFKKS